ncbi:3-dehydroquinate synthase [Lachnospiraceae bacterium NSJ-143]|nr:3-dehydroquinate synthase [Lachnospiraceae bacterium NSJ-143]
MKKISVDTNDKKYNIYFSSGFDSIKEAVNECGLVGRKLCIITDSNVGSIYAQKVKNALEGCFESIYLYSFKAGEKSKNLDTISDFYSFFLENHIDRKTVVAGLGGGVCGDMAGFAAATYLRGIKFIQIPTSLLAQVDSSVGGKVGVDFKGSKNIVGAFYQPEFVFVNMETLDTLSEREFAAGMAEVIKYGPIHSYDFFKYIMDNKEAVKQRDKNCMQHIIETCCKIKAEVVAEDEKESGLREILNFGHTIGHAVETIKGFSLLHGECVAMGMKAAFDICFKRGDITLNEYNEFLSLLAYFGLPLKAEEIQPEEVYSQMFLDKKVKSNKLSFVLLKGYGKPYSTSAVSREEIFDAINTISGDSV